MTDSHYDLVIIGTGSGNSIPGPAFDGASIAIIEEGRFGGTCLNVGCIPTKMLVVAADACYDAAHNDRLGVHTSFTGVDWPAIQQRVFADRIDKISAGGEAYRRGEQCPNIDVYDGHARFVGPHTLVTSSGGVPATITGDTIVVAAGARPHVLKVIEDSGINYLTNDTVMRLAQLPESMTIVGGGFIAAEFAHVFSSFGVKISIVNRSPRLLRKLDEDISHSFTKIARERWTTYLGHTIRSAHQDDAGVHLVLDDGTTVTSECLLAATGRTPNGDRLDCDSAGIVMTDDGRIDTDAFGRTSVDGVWALGDVSSPYQLKHVANAEMRAVAHNITHPDDLRRLPHEVVPSAIFTHPQIATVGMTEAQARESGRDIVVKKQAYADVAYGWALEDTTGFAKLIADKASGKLLGAHIMGPQASTLIGQLITVMSHDISLNGFARSQYWIHPALGELIENAILGLDLD